MTPTENIIQIESKIKDLNNVKENLKNQEKRKKIHEDKKLRMRSNNKGKSNVLGRVSINFKNRQDYINDKREENGHEALSYPKQTELMVKHKRCWKIIEDDIIHYNTGLDLEKDKEDFNEE